jgi:hypothetical protein
MNYTTISQAARRFEDKIQKDDKIKTIIISVLEIPENKEMSNVEA